MIVRYGGSNARKIGDMGGLDAKGYSYVTEEVTHGRSVAWEDRLHYRLLGRARSHTLRHTGSLTVSKAVSRQPGVSDSQQEGRRRD